MTCDRGKNNPWFNFETGLSKSKQPDSYTDTFLSRTAPAGELCDTGLQAAKGYTLMNLLRAGIRQDGGEAKSLTLNVLQSI